MNILEVINSNNLLDLGNFHTSAAKALETGKVLFMPQLTFNLNEEETKFLSPKHVSAKSKNISFDIRTENLKSATQDPIEAMQLKAMMRRYAIWAQQLVNTLLPSYREQVEIARTSFRPVEVLGRPASARKDDTRLHVDAFPSTPNQGRRILRLFTNVNPDNKERVWHVGEDFELVAQQFFPRLSKPRPAIATLLKLIKLTRGQRTAYDHYMLQLHDTMKLDEAYQRNADQVEVRFPAQSTWMVYTDRVSHAALAGQYLFEQTFHLPVTAMQDQHQSPLRILEKIANRTLV